MLRYSSNLLFASLVCLVWLVCFASAAPAEGLEKETQTKLSTNWAVNGFPGPWSHLSPWPAPAFPAADWSAASVMPNYFVDQQAIRWGTGRYHGLPYGYGPVMLRH
ncbi:unnamed protein product [Protopolystoma xenopodis]|uniref:Secreted protein n=1 Tax=Protopolystoma xenopodis TaxID=117903 RepID=A0A3S5BU57_9PLAT|nr:unnamed protein product [Protopolystoma xenopodis]